jgi:hypothetical protein
MKKVIYACPSKNKPVGGVKVIHRHSELLSRMGINSEVFYAYDTNKTVNWFNHNAQIKSDSKFEAGRDFVILPECLIFDLWKKLKNIGVEYGIFVQNGYLINKNIRPDEIDACYASAKSIICISEDAMRCIRSFTPSASNKLVRVIYSVDQNIFFPSEKKENIITYMPRKQKKHSDLLIPSLYKKLPKGWKIQPIDGMTETQVAAALSKSKIFLAFSDFEGLPVPPVEAALCGNFVIGYTGQGGKEYWKAPIFTEIESGDIVDFLEKTLCKVNHIENSGIKINEDDLNWIKAHFSTNHEMQLLRGMLAAFQ